MNIFFDNINLQSNSGPNNFAKKLISEMTKNGQHIVHNSSNECEIDSQLSFIMQTQKLAPTALRLDGIYFNSEQNWKNMNAPIQASFRNSEAVIYQSEFDKKLIEKFFGTHPNGYVVSNGTDTGSISSIEPLTHEMLDNFSEAWSCASSWRPHKRLRENIRYFLEHAPSTACLIVAGENPDYYCEDKRIFFTGNLSWENLIGVFKLSKVFVHLAWLDHCPNVVVDARAAGCHIVCSSTGGTPQIAGTNSTLIEEDEFQFVPLQLYKPPSMNFDQKINNKVESNIEINFCVKKYLEILKDISGC